MADKSDTKNNNYKLNLFFKCLIQLFALNIIIIIIIIYQSFS